jgi:NhaP-type Na+/H+ or K+/H+ antiporter
MVAVLVFAVALLLATLISGLAQRSVISIAVLFLITGFVAGNGMLGIVSLQPDAPLVLRLADMALFTVLFTDGMRVGAKELASAWQLPGRALLFGLPLTLLATAVLAHLIAGIGWKDAFLVGAILSPTDPVFAAAIVGRREIPQRLRHLLNVESGFNDGLALPIVVAMLAYMGAEKLETAELVGELALGVALGIAVPWIGVRLARYRLLTVSDEYGPFFALAIGLCIWSLSALTGANEYLAAFSAGITLATVSSDLRDAFHRFGEVVAEVFKLAALLAFGALISPRFLGTVGFGWYGFALLALLLPRPIAIELALLGSPLSRKERTIAAWFGPKGFASVIYGIMVLDSGLPESRAIFHLIAIVIIGSIIAHSSTDVPIARWFHGDNDDSRPTPDSSPPAPRAAPDRSTLR